MGAPVHFAEYAVTATLLVKTLYFWLQRRPLVVKIICSQIKVVILAFR